MPKNVALDPPGILRALVDKDVRFVVIGGIAGALHGSTTLTADVDVLYDRDSENLDRLAAALGALHAVRRDVPPDVNAPVDVRALRNGANFLLTTDLGDLDCIAETPSGAFTYVQVAPTAERMKIDRGFVVPVASLDQLIRMKRASGRPKDRIEVETLAALRSEREKRRRR